MSLSFFRPSSATLHRPLHRVVGVYVVLFLGWVGSFNAAVFAQGPVIFFTNLFSFNGTNGRNPNTPLLEVSPGIFYGTTVYGGTNTNSYGTVFRLSTAGVFTNLLTFGGANGSAPKGLTLGLNGNIYGTAAQGGGSISNDPYHIGYGTVFQFNTNGSINTLMSFNNSNGASPNRLLQSANGLLYGTATTGGVMPPSGVSYGTIFSITTNGFLTNLLFFNNSDGANPNSALSTRSNALFFGTTAYGGALQQGAIFSLDTNGAYTFYDVFNGTNGTTPNNLVAAPDGSYYGTTLYGSANGFGTIFRFTTNGILQNLYNFGGLDGKIPTAFIRGNDGNYFGTTSQGGASNNGTVFEFTTNGSLMTLHSFTGGTDGNNPNALIQGQDGNLYGSTTYGGINDNGVIFRVVTVPNPTFISAVKNGSSVTLKWNAVSGHTYEIQCEASLAGSTWNVLQQVVATNSIATYVDTTATAAQRYYRLRVVN